MSVFRQRDTDTDREIDLRDGDGERPRRAAMSFTE
jgi:hypothetical protein